MNNFSKLKDLVMSLESDFEKFYDKNNSAAGTRVRKGMQELKNMAQDIRKEVQDMKNSSTEKAGAKK
ncbi:MAG: histone H1 [Hymenobacteraceae bacterium]|nr:histone H1 [Hymenobacteraceae bacterium]MDX5398056.1 histone H1 [Hymenobacteraceae bacterium]MDX5444275.1 histone H1 [Hymenobacteraceae bacterium]MDX5514127.1 histone H1 [Hymenobacteraceae bacterium]